MPTSKLTVKKFTQVDFNRLKKGENACPRNRDDGEPADLTFLVGRHYLAKNPSDPTDTLEVWCTQSSPYSLIAVNG